MGNISDEKTKKEGPFDRKRNTLQLSDSPESDYDVLKQKKLIKANNHKSISYIDRKLPPKTSHLSRSITKAKSSKISMKNRA